ncbi:glycosyl hydrolase family 88 [Paenibacillus sp. Soil766]|uniref:glycoside hydrolase family 88/105 protein n=1 Tax=Paenibacillus sp. Soil766 TaxID=1736404 RepID=UPI00070FAEFD|nr:glycoside hydrolase family 88 protein [Paenibacillus sp. Soil766]KRF01128.1 glycosyl hydrolase family 88 [Paenibacillus sp. Soil766]
MTTKWSVRMSESFMKQYPIVSDMPFQRARSWNYENGCILSAFEYMWLQTGDQRYLDYIQMNMDLFITSDGGIYTYRLEEYNVDQINQGKSLFLLFEQTGDDRYRKALELLVTQMKSHPRTTEGGLWHKKIYPYQMWLDGVYMTAPLLARYAHSFGASEWFDDVAHEIILMEKRARDPKTGLLYHGWDESREQRWADSISGCSPHFWGRGLGWYMMAIVDVLDYLPKDHRNRGLVIGLFYRLAEAIARVQDPETGLWYQVLDKGQEAGNYLEASGSSMFVYALAKGARKGYLSHASFRAASKGFQGLLVHCLEEDTDGSLHLNQICSVAGLGGNPYRDGSYAYYMSEPVRRDDPKGFAPFIMACLEMEEALVSDPHRR